MITVLLRAAHTHAGTQHAAGTVLAMPGDSAAWLIRRGLAHVIASPRTARIKPTSPPRPADTDTTGATP